MAPATYTVMQRGGQWKLVVDECEFGSFASQGRAIETAIATAHEAGRSNFRGAQVILQPLDAMSQVIWTYGRDPYPPTRFG